MIVQKKKIIQESKSVRTKDNKSYGHDKCPKKAKDCSKCKILDCPEER
jgi:hypothetical protein